MADDNSDYSSDSYGKYDDDGDDDCAAGDQEAFVKAHNAMIRSMCGDYSSDEEERGGREHPAYPGYTYADLREQVTFLRPEWDDERQEFDSEGKDVDWCLCNGFAEVEPGVWSGPWYFRRFPDEQPYQRPSRKAKKKKKGAAKSHNVGPESFAAAMARKRRGNDAFGAGEYHAAIDCYDEASELLGGEMVGVLLAGEQREEMLKIISNKAECNIRLGRYTEAAANAGYALQVDKTHAKSLLRCAKALFRGAGCDGFGGIESFACIKAIELTEKVVALNGPGVEEARALKEEIEARLQVDIDRMGGGAISGGRRHL